MKNSKRALSAALLLGLSLSPSIAHAQTVDFLSSGPSATYGGTYNTVQTPVFSTDASTLTTTFKGPVIIPGNLGIGIGAAAPTQRFVVSADSGATTAFMTAANGVGYVGTLSNSDLHLQANNYDRMVIQSSTGYVGIGTPSPQAALHVNGDLLVPYTNAIRMGIPSAGGGEAIHSTYGEDGDFGIALMTGFADHLVVTHAGNVGIGIEAPATTLDVNGSLRATTSNTVAGWGCSPEGAMGYDASNHAPVYCNQSGIWQKSGGHPVASENIFCQIGSGITNDSANCKSSASSGTQSISKTTTNVHDLCTLNIAGGWAGGMWGWCTIQGNPGTTWTLDASNFNGQQVNCSMVCYDF